MFKLKKLKSLVLNVEKLRFFSAAMADAITQQPKFAQQATLNPDASTPEPLDSLFSYSLDPKFYISSLIKCRNIFQIRQVHAQVTVTGMLHDLALANKLLYVYAQHRALVDAFSLFGGMAEKDPASWSVMIGGFAKDGDIINCFGTFRELIRCGARPDNYTLPFMIRACRDKMDLMLGRLIHGIVWRCGLLLDHFVCAALVDLYAECKVIEDARQLFDKMLNKDVVTWTVMIGGYAECGNPNDSLVLFDRMRGEGVAPDKVAMVTVVNACAKLGAIRKAKLVYDYICRNKFSLDVILGTAIIDMYAKCGRVDCARETFDSMKERNVISWSAMIAAYGYHGQGRKALDLFPMMLSSGVVPNRITFVSLLYACSHSGLVDEGLRLFSLMHDAYAVKPDVKHYTCVVDLLGRAGRLNEAAKLIEDMAVEKDEGVWGALLSACRMHANIDLAEKAANALLDLQPQNPGHYVLLSNIYANAGRWDDMAKIRNLMTKMRLKKIPGYTWIEVDNKLYQFSIGDRSNPWSQEIFRKLSSLIKKLELAGYVPDTNLVLHDVDDEVKREILYTHSEKLAIAFGLIAIPSETPIVVTKNLRVCGDCHTFTKFVSAITNRVIIVRDANRFHHFNEGACSCGDYW